jgi:spermidine/putrescine transport system permease protein
MNRRRSEVSLTLPSLLWLLFFFLVPTIIVFLYAFKKSNVYGAIIPGWTFDTFKSLLTPYYIHIILRTLWISILTTVISLGIAIPVGYYISRIGKTARQILLMLIVIPFWSSFLIRIFAWKSLLHPEGLIKNVLLSMGLVSENATLLYHDWTVVMVMVYAYLPFGILPIFAASSKFQWDLLEAALDLGASRFQAFYKVYLPGIRSGIVTAFIMIFIPAAGAYVIPDIVGGISSEMIGNKIVQKTLMERNLPEASVLSMFLAMTILIPISITALFQNRKLNLREVKRNVE